MPDKLSPVCADIIITIGVLSCSILLLTLNIFQLATAPLI